MPERMPDTPDPLGALRHLEKRMRDRVTFAILSAVGYVSDKEMDRFADDLAASVAALEKREAQVSGVSECRNCGAFNLIEPCTSDCENCGAGLHEFCPKCSKDALERAIVGLRAMELAHLHDDQSTMAKLDVAASEILRALVAEKDPEERP